MNNKIKNISIIVLAIALVASIIGIIWLNNKYDTNETYLKTQSDSLCTVIDLQKTSFDSLKSHSDSVYSYELQRNDSLNQIIKTSQEKHRTVVTYVYKDSTIIKEVEDTKTNTELQTVYVDRIVEKEVIKTIHDTVHVTKIDTVYNEQNTQVTKQDEESKKEVVVKDDLFNVYIDAGVKGNLDFDIIPEANVGIIIKEKFYGEVGIDYNNGKVNPSAKLGVRMNLF